PAGVVLRLSAPVAAEDEDVLTEEDAGTAIEGVLRRLRQLPLLDLRRDREGDEAQQQPADREDQDPAQPGPLASHHPRQPAPPAALGGGRPDAGQAGLADAVPQAGPRAIDPVRRSLSLVRGLLLRRGRALLTRSPAPPVDRVFGLAALLGLAGAPGPTGLL